MKRTYKNLKNLAKKANHISLYTLISGIAYIDNDWTKFRVKEPFVDLLAKALGGRDKRNLKRGLSDILENHIYIGAIAERLVYSEKANAFKYIACQDYAAELNTLRRLIYKHA